MRHSWLLLVPVMWKPVRHTLDHINTNDTPLTPTGPSHVETGETYSWSYKHWWDTLDTLVPVMQKPVRHFLSHVNTGETLWLLVMWKPVRHSLGHVNTGETLWLLVMWKPVRHSLGHGNTGETLTSSHVETGETFSWPCKHWWDTDF